MLNFSNDKRIVYIIVAISGLVDAMLLTKNFDHLDH